MDVPVGQKRTYEGVSHRVGIFLQTVVACSGSSGTNWITGSTENDSRSLDVLEKYHILDGE